MTPGTPLPSDDASTPTPSDLQSVAQQAARDVIDQQRPSVWSRIAASLPLVATLATVVIALLTTLQSQSQYRETQANERFQTAVTMLAASDLSTRLGGIYTLTQVAQSYPAREYASTHILAAYLRSRFPSTAATRAVPLTGLPAVEEVSAVMAGLGLRSDHSSMLDLGRISARGLLLRDQDLRGLVFSDADLSGSVLAGADLSGVPFQRSVLTNTDFQGATLTGVDFTGADLKGASFIGTDLMGSKGLTAAQLAEAKTDSATVRPGSLK
jgi:Pentapeptide repeats (8 copies)